MFALTQHYRIDALPTCLHLTFLTRDSIEHVLISSTSDVRSRLLINIESFGLGHEWSHGGYNMYTKTHTESGSKLGDETVQKEVN